MTQYVDEVARAVRKDRFERNFRLSAHDPDVEPREGDILDARAAMRAVLRQLREPSREMCLAGLRYDYNDALTGTENASAMFCAMLDAFEKECGI